MSALLAASETLPDSDKSDWEKRRAVVDALHKTSRSDPFSDRIPSKRLLRFTAPDIPRWLVFEDKLSVTITSTAGDISLLRIEVLPETKEVAFSCSLDISTSGHVQIEWRDKTDPMGPSGTVNCEIRYFKSTSLNDVMDGSPTVNEWHSKVSAAVTEKTTLHNKSAEQDIVIFCPLTKPVFGVASFPPDLQGQDAIDVSDDGQTWTPWRDHDFDNVAAPTIFTSPPNKLYVRGKIPPQADVPLSFLYSPNLNIWEEITGQ